MKFPDQIIYETEKKKVHLQLQIVDWKKECKKVKNEKRKEKRKERKKNVLRAVCTCKK